jgi:acyl-CoA reductase-like NAD-dependent aldehyde dehydrogenase
MGPLASAAQLASVAGHVEDAIGTGARPVTGGARWGGEPCAGYFVPPTILADVRADDPVVREEVFGPVATVLTASDYDEAVALANDTPFGLSASIFTNQLRKALDFTRQVRAGIVKINQGTSGTEYHVPFGGLKGSGVGPREQGKAARTFFTESKTVYLGTGPAA